MRRTLLLILLLTVNLAAGPAAIRLKVRPEIAQAPQTIQVKVLIERAPENRKLVLVVDGPNYYRSTQWELAGEASAAVFDVWWQELPCGNYEITATLQRNDNRVNRITAPLHLLGFACPTSDEP